MCKSSTPEDGASAEAKAAFHLRMRARGLRDVRVLRAFELVPRAFFVAPVYADLAARDLPIPIACGQTLLEPGLVARMIEALDVGSDHHVLEIGAGTGYAAAILASLARAVTSVERFESLAQAARGRVRALGIGNADIAWGDGLVLPPAGATFDRILVHGVVPAIETIVARLRVGGILVFGRGNPAIAGVPHVVRAQRMGDGTLEHALVCSGRLPPMIAGLGSS